MGNVLGKIQHQDTAPSVRVPVRDGIFPQQKLHRNESWKEHMKRLTLLTALLILGSALAFSQTAIKDAVSTPKPGTVFIKGDPDFAVAISAAMRKKDVPATIVLDEKNAEYILRLRR